MEKKEKNSFFKVLKFKLHGLLSKSNLMFDIVFIKKILYVLDELIEQVQYKYVKDVKLCRQLKENKKQTFSCSWDLAVTMMDGDYSLQLNEYVYLEYLPYFGLKASKKPYWNDNTVFH